MRAEPSAAISNLLTTDQVVFATAVTLTSWVQGTLSSNLQFSHSAAGAVYRPASLFSVSDTAAFLAFEAEL
jgi:hypothetical protein